MAGERGLYRSVCRGLGEAIVEVLLLPLCSRLEVPAKLEISDWCLYVAASRRTTGQVNLGTERQLNLQPWRGEEVLVKKR